MVCADILFVCLFFSSFARYHVRPDLHERMLTLIPAIWWTVDVWWSSSTSSRTLSARSPDRQSCTFHFRCSGRCGDSLCMFRSFYAIGASFAFRLITFWSCFHIMDGVLVLHAPVVTLVTFWSYWHISVGPSTSCLMTFRSYRWHSRFL